MKLGTVVFYHADKKYGHIKPHDGGRDIFFHINSGRAVKRSESGPPELSFHEYLTPPCLGDVICMIEIVPSKVEGKYATAFTWVYQIDWVAMGGTMPASDQPGQALESSESTTPVEITRVPIGNGSPVAVASREDGIEDPGSGKKGRFARA